MDGWMDNPVLNVALFVFYTVLLFLCFVLYVIIILVRFLCYCVIQEYEGRESDITITPWTRHISVIAAFKSIIKVWTHACMDVWMFMFMFLTPQTHVLTRANTPSLYTLTHPLTHPLTHLHSTPSHSFFNTPSHSFFNTPSHPLSLSPSPPRSPSPSLSPSPPCSLPLIKNPDDDEYLDVLWAGEAATWPFIARIKAQCQVPQTMTSLHSYASSHTH